MALSGFIFSLCAAAVNPYNPYSDIDSFLPWMPSLTQPHVTWLQQELDSQLLLKPTNISLRFGQNQYPLTDSHLRGNDFVLLPIMEVNK